MFLPKIWIICRVCLQQREEMFNIYDDKIVENIWSLLRDCGGVPVRKSDNLPDKICEACLRRLCKANNFRRDCQRGHRELVQILIERSVNLYEFDLEEERKNCDDVITISDTKTKYSVSCYLRNLDQQITNELTQNTENVVEPTTEDQNTLESPTKYGDNIKQYCVVTKNNDKEKEIVEKITKPNKKEPIVLLLKLKNSPTKKNTNKKRNTTDRTTKTTSKVKTRENSSAKGSNKLESKIESKNTKLKSENIKTKADTSEKKVKTKSNIAKRSEKGTGKFTCKICKNKYDTYVLLRHHMYIHNRPHQCKICKKSFSQIQAFLCHNNHHTGIKPYYCRFCYRTFSDITNRNSHERKMHKKQEYKCDKCNKIFRFTALLQKHAQSHRQKKCFICNKEFASLQTVRKHHQRQHLELKNDEKEIK